MATADERQFWWVSQGYNHPVAIAQGSLWSLPSKRRRLPDRELLRQMAVDDVVIHYQGPAVRAVSVVSQPWRDHHRPNGYQMRPGEGDIGWLVEVDVREQNLFLHRDQVAEIVTHGTPGPLDRNGTPRQIYVARLKPHEARNLLVELKVDEPLPRLESPMFGLSEAEWAEITTDAEALRRVRLEQLALRRHLLEGRESAACALCGRHLPSRLLVAAHIKPRRLLNHAERAQFESIAMLACALGCDALFESGYIVVNSDGVIESGTGSPMRALDQIIDELSGRQCGAHHARTATAFREHRALHGKGTT